MSPVLHSSTPSTRMGTSRGAATAPKRPRSTNPARSELESAVFARLEEVDARTTASWPTRLTASIFNALRMWRRSSSAMARPSMAWVTVMPSAAKSCPSPIGRRALVLITRAAMTAATTAQVVVSASAVHSRDGCCERSSRGCRTRSVSASDPRILSASVLGDEHSRGLPAVELAAWRRRIETRSGLGRSRLGLSRPLNRDPEAGCTGAPGEGVRLATRVSWL